jgi:hypothetical protein
MRCTVIKVPVYAFTLFGTTQLSKDERQTATMLHEERQTSIE